MLEVEMKFPVLDFAAVEQHLHRVGARSTGQVEEADHYFNAPDRDFARTDEALRMRRIGSANFVTYKGPKRDPRTKIRTEIEVPLAEGEANAEAFALLLVHLGYRPVAIVCKQRRTYRMERAGFDIEACLDTVAEVGTFIELEIVAPEERLNQARDQVLNLAGEIGLTTSERRSYLELLLANRGEIKP
jgi:adenylate cyclase class 2